jgi:hypothetical protein
MLKKELLFLPAIILMGVLDWLTTVTAILFFGATETNPLFSGLTRSSMIIFSVVKLSAVILVGFTFYIAAAISRSTINHRHLTERLLNGGYSLTFLTLTVLVANNMIAVFRL